MQDLHYNLKQLLADAGGGTEGVMNWGDKGCVQPVAVKLGGGNGHTKR